MKKAAELEEKREQVEQTIHQYEEAFNRMLSLTKTTSTNNLVDRFLYNEDRSFALFNYVSEIYGEIEKLLDENEGVGTPFSFRYCKVLLYEWSHTLCSQG